MRLFAALVPPPGALAHLAAALAPWTGRSADGPGPRIRWGDPELWHVTLAFYGEVPEGALPELAWSLRQGLAQVRAPTARLRGAGSFAGRTLWVGVAGATAADGQALADLLAVAKDVGAGLGTVLEPRDRNRAHLTVARLSAGPREGRSGALDAAVHALSVYEGPSWPAHEAVLVSSRLGEGRRGGPLHEVVAELPIGGDYCWM